MASFGGLERCTGAVREHATATLVQELLKMLPKELLESQLGSKLDEAAAGLREGLEQGSLSPTVLRSVLQRPMAIGVGRLTIRGMGPSLALVVDEGNAGGDLDKLIDELIASRAPRTNEIVALRTLITNQIASGEQDEISALALACTTMLLSDAAIMSR